MSDELKAALADVPVKWQGAVTWGERKQGSVLGWAACVGPVREFGHASAAAAIRAAIARLPK